MNGFSIKILIFSVKLGILTRGAMETDSVLAQGLPLVLPYSLPNE